MLDKEEQLRQITNGSLDPAELEGLVGISYVIDRAVASHPGANNIILKLLSASPDIQTRRHVIKNPNVGQTIILSLASEFPHDFFTHPMLPFMLLEDPEVLRNLKPGALQAFLGSDDCSQALVMFATRNGSQGEQMAVLRRADVQLDIVELLTKSQFPRVAESAFNKCLEM